MLDNEVTQPPKFRTKNWVETNDDASRTYNTNSQIKFKTILVKTGLCDYSDAYIYVKETKTAPGQGADAATVAEHRNHKQVIFKNCAPFTDCINEITHRLIMPKIMIL